MPGRNRDKEPADSRARSKGGGNEGGEDEKEERDKGGHEGERGDDCLEPSWLTREGARRRRSHGSSEPCLRRGRGSPRD